MRRASRECVRSAHRRATRSCAMTLEKSGACRGAVPLRLAGTPAGYIELQLCMFSHQQLAKYDDYPASCFHLPPPEAAKKLRGTTHDITYPPPPTGTQKPKRRAQRRRRGEWRRTADAGGRTAALEEWTRLTAFNPIISWHCTGRVSSHRTCRQADV